MRNKNNYRYWLTGFVQNSALLFASIVISAIAMTPVSGLSSTIGGTAGAFMRLGIGADRLGMGDVGTAIGGEIMNWYYNPAGLPFIEERNVALGYRSMSLDRSMMYATFATHLEPTAGLSFTFMRAATDNIDGRYSSGVHFQSLEYSENLICGSFGLNPVEKISAGISIKWYISSVPDIVDDNKNETAYGMGVDLGIMYFPTEWLNFGFQLRDIDSHYSWETSDTWGDELGATDDAFPTLMRFGTAATFMQDYLFAIDAVFYPQESGDASAFEVHTGLEYTIPLAMERNAYVRTGWNGKAPTFGFGIDLDLRYLDGTLDYAYILDPETPNSSQFISWLFRF